MEEWRTLSSANCLWRDNEVSESAAKSVPTGNNTRKYYYKGRIVDCSRGEDVKMVCRLRGEEGAYLYVHYYVCIYI